MLERFGVDREIADVGSRHLIVRISHTNDEHKAGGRGGVPAHHTHDHNDSAVAC